MRWNDKLPNVDDWQPRSRPSQTLTNALMITCQYAQARIMSGVDHEIQFNEYSFDSGLVVEDLVRSELSNLLPRRYEVSPGIVSDRKGRTAGEIDLLVWDNLWSSVLKPSVAEHSRRLHLPIESVYAATEIKQSLGFRELDKAMRKMVQLSRLYRPENPYGHITENQHLVQFDKEGSILNPLYTTVFGTRLRSECTFDDIVSRFATINARLSREQMVKMLCVLGHGAAWYSVASGNPYNATYMTDRQEHLILQIDHQEPDNVFYRFYVEWLGHLTRSVLGLGDFSSAYGEPPPERKTVDWERAVFNRHQV